MTIEFHWEAFEGGVTITLTKERRLLFGRTRELILNEAWPDFDSIVALSGVAQLHVLLEVGDGAAQEVGGGEGFLLTHAAIADLSDIQAKGLGLPPTIPFVMNIDTRGGITQSDFWVGWSWLDKGRAVPFERQGAIATVGGDRYRIPQPMLGTIEDIEALQVNAKNGFGVTGEKERFDAQVAAVAALCSKLSFQERVICADTLDQVKLAHATAFSLRVTGDRDNPQIAPVLFGKEVVKEVVEEGTVVDEARQLLPIARSQGFQALFSNASEIKSTYVLESGEYVFIDPSLKPALEVLRGAQRGSADVRRDFVRRPQGFLKQHLRAGRSVDDPVLDAIEADAIDQLFVETRQFSERVIDLGLYERPDLPWLPKDRNEWKPDSFSLYVQGKFISIDGPSLPGVIDTLRTALGDGRTEVTIDGVDVRPNQKLLEKLEELLPVSPDNPPPPPDEPGPDDEEPPGGPIVLLTRENFESVDYAALMQPRASLGQALPLADLSPATTLMPHQVEAVNWIVKAYEAGWPGVLIADDMGLGKTLEALAFLSLLRERNIARAGNPILVVAPVGLLKNWEQEHDRHLDHGFGKLTRVFGKHLRGDLRVQRGQDIKTGIASLNVDEIADSEWVLTTYETLRDYQASFGRVPFSCVVFDEMQKVKNPRSLVTHAAKTLNAKFSIGMTGTPVENSLADLWTIMDILSPGFLGDLREFILRYPSDEEQQLSALSKLLLKGPPQKPAPVLRRMKNEIIKDLPTKTVVRKPSSMPALQAQAYLDAHNENEAGRLKMIEVLHKFRSVSLHPVHPTQADDLSFDEYIEESARLAESFKVLDEIAERNEKVLIFLESRVMQPILAEMIKQRYRLDRLPMIINGAITGEARQDAVNTFQSESGRFDVMILSPRAGGVGITLTTANNVIHLQRWWNPAVEDQCSDRVYRIGQKLDVNVYLPQTVHDGFGDMSFDVVLHELLERRRNVAEGVFRPMAIEAGDFAGKLGMSRSQNPEIDFQEIDEMDPLYFEDWIAKRLRKHQLEVRTTQYSHDGGADLVVRSRKTKRVALVQIKHRSRPSDLVGTEAIKDLVRAQKAYGDGKANLIAITNAQGFAPTAVADGKQIGAALFSRNDLQTFSDVMAGGLSS